MQIYNFHNFIKLIQRNRHLSIITVTIINNSYIYQKYIYNRVQYSISDNKIISHENGCYKYGHCADFAV